MDGTNPWICPFHPQTPRGFLCSFTCGLTGPVLGCRHQTAEDLTGRAKPLNFFYSFSIFNGCVIATSLLTHQFFLPHVEWIHTLKVKHTRTQKNRELKV